MTKDNRRQNLLAELARAEQSIKSAEALLAIGLCADAVSRAYYAAYHFLRALLFSRGVEPRSHAGAIHLFNTEFVQSGLLASAHNRTLAGLQRSRELADYDAAVAFGLEDARKELEAARAFGSEVKAFLKNEGWLDAG